VAQITDDQRVRLAEDEARVVELAVKGYRYVEIVRELDGRLNLASVRRVLKDHATTVRARCAERVADRFNTHDALLADLIHRTYRDLCKGFCKDRAAALCKYLERQARLLGLDAAKDGRSLYTDEWIDTASDAELRTFLKTRYKLDIPEENPTDG
jgi:hypothetical protein